MVRSKNSWGCAQTVLNAFERWLEDATWSDALFGKKVPNHPAFHQENWLGMLVENVAEDHYGDMQSMLMAWKELAERQKLPEKANYQESLRQAALRLHAHLSLGKAKKFPELPSNAKYVIILLDATRKRDPALAELTARFAERVSTDATLKTQASVVIGRLGQESPVAFQMQAPDAEVILPDALHALPALAAGFLEQASPANTACIIALTNSAIIDQDDWQSHWENTPFFHYGSSVKNNVPLPFYSERIVKQEKMEDVVFDLLQKTRKILRPVNNKETA
jgi:hypothetical protein